MLKVSQICLRNQNRAFTLRLVDVLCAEKEFCTISTGYDTTFCRICCSSIKTQIEHAPYHCAPAMSTSRQQHPATKRKRALEQLLPDVSSDIRPYWPDSAAFLPQRVLLSRIFFNQFGQDQIRVCRLLPCTRLPAAVENRRHTEGRVEIHRSQRRAYRHAGGLSAQVARFRLQWRRDRGRVR